MTTKIRKPTKKEMENARGNCYERAFAFMAKLPDSEVNQYRVVHGEMIGRTGEVKNRQFGHAWIERGNLIIDPSGDGRRKPKKNSKELYYRYHSVVERSVKKYTRKQMYKTGLKAGGHYGPWSSAKKS